ncbi:hypothetical protein QAD02_012250 [Eretmocerus hayati]|uniref:Uncharacterized protein n=1 Tax=Eretmocerus hayati TaxID=131215 RepID=A0ACC2NZ27_9HYME|nr:hypothetical protein QAD02_012250 [Eretmocerus hayati]
MQMLILLGTFTMAVYVCPQETTTTPTLDLYSRKRKLLDGLSRTLNKIKKDLSRENINVLEAGPSNSASEFVYVTCKRKRIDQSAQRSSFRDTAETESNLVLETSRINLKRRTSCVSPDSGEGSSKAGWVTNKRRKLEYLEHQQEELEEFKKKITQEWADPNPMESPVGLRGMEKSWEQDRLKILKEQLMSELSTCENILSSLRKHACGESVAKPSTTKSTKCDAETDSPVSERIVLDVMSLKIGTCEQMGLIRQEIERISDELDSMTLRSEEPGCKNTRNQESSH